MKKVLIIGAGPAGISASLYLARSGIAEVTVAHSGSSALMKADRIENYFGFAEPVSGAELLENSIRNAGRLGVSFTENEIVGLSITPDLRFEAEFKSGSQVYDSVLIATGTARKTPPIKGLKKFEGKGVSYCAVCDAFFFRGRAVAVIGDGEYAAHEASVLSNTASEVTILTNGKPFTGSAPDGIKVIETAISEIRGEGRVSGVEFSDGSTKACEGVFIAVGTAGSTDLARKTGAAVDGNKIITDENMMTTVPGLFAAGDCTGGILQVSTAVGEGAKAGLAMIKHIKNQS